MLGLLGFVFAYTCVWAAPEQMTMISTLSEPIGSFWTVQTKKPVVFSSENQTLNLGTKCESCSSGASSIKLQINNGNNPAFTLDELTMEDKTTFKVKGLSTGSPATWKVEKIEVNPGGNVSFKNMWLLINEFDLNTLTGSGTGQLGQNVTINIGKPEETGKLYIGGSSLNVKTLRIDNSSSCPEEDENSSFCVISSQGLDINGKTASWTGNYFEIFD